MEAGDTVIISATPVPGNEKAVTKVVNSLAKIGADVYDKSRARVHVSGHASAEELKIMLTIVQPKAFMPGARRGHASSALTHVWLKPLAFLLKTCSSAKTVRAWSCLRRALSMASSFSPASFWSTACRSAILPSRCSKSARALSAQGFAAIAAAVSGRKKAVAGNVQVEMHGITGGDDGYLVQECEKCVKTR